MISRRDFLKTLGAAAGAAVLNGCARGFDLSSPESYVVQLASPAPPPVPTGTPLPAPTQTGTATFAPSPSPTQPPLSGAAGFNTPSGLQSGLPGWMPTPAPTEDPRQLCFVLWDHQLARYGYRPRNMKVPLPETVPLASGGVNRLNQDWIDYWQGILKLANPGMSKDEFKSSWNSLVADNRAFTNGTSPESDNFALHSLTCGGATHELVTGLRKGHFIQIYTLNIHEDPPPIPDTPHDIDMTRHFFATTGSHDKLPNGTYAVYGFPQFENCIVPLVSPADRDWIAISRIKAVTTFHSPYNLPPQQCQVPFGCTPTPGATWTPAS